MKVLMITGGAGFIGSNFVRYLLERYEYKLVVFDKLTYAGNLNNLKGLEEDPRFTFLRGDICDAEAVRTAIREHKVDAIVNFAAETHVDRSILEPDAFIRTDVYGTYVLLEACREFGLRFHQVSTDEVYGDVEPPRRSREEDPLLPRSPYAASKAGAEHLVRAYHITYGLHTTVTRGSNNIGPYQYPEKVVPLFITNALDDLPLPVYGDGMQVRDYQYVEDHCAAIDLVLHKGKPGEVFNVGTGVETRNLDLAKKILALLGKPESLIQFVGDRPGHDRRYALDISRLEALGWRNRYTLDQALEKTVRWYVENEWWWRPLKGPEFWAYFRRNYERKGLRLPEGFPQG